MIHKFEFNGDGAITSIEFETTHGISEHTVAFWLEIVDMWNSPTTRNEAIAQLKDRFAAAIRTE